MFLLTSCQALPTGLSEEQNNIGYRFCLYIFLQRTESDVETVFLRSFLWLRSAIETSIATAIINIFIRSSYLGWIKINSKPVKSVEKPSGSEYEHDDEDGSIRALNASNKSSYEVLPQLDNCSPKMVYCSVTIVPECTKPGSLEDSVFSRVIVTCITLHSQLVSGKICSVRC